MQGVNIDRDADKAHIPQKVGVILMVTSAKEYNNMMRTPGQRSQYRGEGWVTYFDESLKDSPA